MSTLIRANNLTKVFSLGEVEVRALREVSFEIEKGDFIVILGPSGSGKSTMLNIIGGIDTATTGEIFYEDIALHELNKTQITTFRRDYVGFIFQFYNLIPNLTALENIELASELSNNPLDSRQLLERVGLGDRADHFPSKLSGGQQQRISIARALCKNPDLLLCDEPTGALDIKTGAEILELLCEFNKEYNKTIIVVTHNADIAKVADKVFYFKDGKIDRLVVNEHPMLASEVEW